MEDGDLMIGIIANSRIEWQEAITEHVRKINSAYYRCYSFGWVSFVHSTNEIAIPFNFIF